ncbi:hypothetical protein [Actinoplanes couchii]|nr:hypothetical protein [Actinoplanes couchii]MDR6322052.1 hypothetical protein [Actinoplanes couchii]
MNKTMLAGLLALTTLTMTGCGQGPQRLDGAAAPHGVTAASSPTSPTPAPPSPSASATPSATPSKSVTAPATRRTTEPVFLGPDGYGTLKFGMTRAEAEATGLIKGYRTVDLGTTKCGRATLKATGGQLYFAADQGLITMFAAGGTRTPEGIRVGSTAKAVLTAYPDAELVYGTDPANDKLTVDLPGVARYHLDTRDGKVIHLSLSMDNIFTGSGCLE